MSGAGPLWEPAAGVDDRFESLPALRAGAAARLQSQVDAHSLVELFHELCGNPTDASADSLDGH